MASQSPTKSSSPAGEKKFADPNSDLLEATGKTNTLKDSSNSNSFDLAKPYSVWCVPRAQWPKTTDAKACQYKGCDTAFGFFSMLPGQRGSCNCCGIVCCAKCLEHKIELPPSQPGLVAVCPACYSSVLEKKAAFWRARLEANGGGSTPSSSPSASMSSATAATHGSEFMSTISSMAAANQGASHDNSRRNSAAVDATAAAASSATTSKNASPAPERPSSGSNNNTPLDLSSNNNDNDNNSNSNINDDVSLLKEENAGLKQELADMQMMVEETTQRLEEAVMERDELEEQVQLLVEELDAVKALAASGGSGGLRRVDESSTSVSTMATHSSGIGGSNASSAATSMSSQQQQQPLGRRAGKAKPVTLHSQASEFAKLQTPRDAYTEFGPSGVTAVRQHHEHMEQLHSAAMSMSAQSSSGTANSASTSISSGGSSKRRGGGKAKPAVISSEGLHDYAKMTPRDLAAELGLSSTGSYFNMPSMTPAAGSDSGPAPPPGMNLHLPQQKLEEAMHENEMQNNQRRGSGAAAAAGGRPPPPPPPLRTTSASGERSHSSSGRGGTPPKVPPPPPPRRGGGRAKPVPLEQVLSSFAKLTPRDALADFGLAALSGRVGGGDGPTATPRAGDSSSPNAAGADSDNDDTADSGIDNNNNNNNDNASGDSSPSPPKPRRGGGKSKPPTLNTDVSPQVVVSPREFAQSYIAGGSGFSEADLIGTMMQLQQAGAMLESGENEDGEETVYLRVPVAAAYDDIFDDMATPRIIGSTQSGAGGGSGSRMNIALGGGGRGASPRSNIRSLVTPRAGGGGGGGGGGEGHPELEAENAALRIQLISARRLLQESTGGGGGGEKQVG